MTREQLLKAKQLAAERLEIIRLKIATNPKVILLRLRLFGIYPALGKHFLKIAGISVLAIFTFGVFYFFSFRAPRPFPDQALITIGRGEPLSQIASSFKEKGIVRSSFWLKVLIVMWGGDKRVIAGDYYFPNAISVFKAARMIRKGEFGLVAIKVTVPEGTNSYEMAKILEKELPAFDAQDFVNEVLDNGYEGYLFPDTYFFTPNTKASEVILTMRESFARQIQAYEEDIAKSGKPLEELVIIASIIEDEANSNLESKRIVSGILWNRLREKMPLQVDAPFQYYNGKNSYTLTKSDLNEDHPFNTYTNKGLTPTAITNPGIDSLRAAIAPTNTGYLYFLSDKKGNMHYAKTFEEHKRNRELYLN